MNDASKTAAALLILADYMRALAYDGQAEPTIAHRVAHALTAEALGAPMDDFEAACQDVQAAIAEATEIGAKYYGELMLYGLAALYDLVEAPPSLAAGRAEQAPRPLPAEQALAGGYTLIVAPEDSIATLVRLYDGQASEGVIIAQARLTGFKTELTHEDSSGRLSATVGADMAYLKALRAFYARVESERARIGVEDFGV